MDICGQICIHFLKLTGTSIMSLVVELVSLSRHNQNGKFYSNGITNLRNLKQKFSPREMFFQEIIYIAVFLMMLEPESIVKDKTTLMVF